MSEAIINKRKETWKKFIDLNSSLNNVYIIHYMPDVLTRPQLWPSKKNERIEWAWRMYSLHMERIEWLDDDSIPYLDMLTGTEIFAEAFGCKVHRDENNMPFALPLIKQASDVSRLKVPDLWDSSLAYLFEMADELKRRAGKDALLRMVDIQSPIDIAALIFDKNYFYIALLEEPEMIHELTSKIKDLLTAFLDEWFARYGKEFIAHFPTYYMPQGITLSEDEVGVVNKAMFDEFFLPELNELSDRYGGIGIHCCADSEHQWENFKKIRNLKMLNLVRSPESTRNSWSFFADFTAQFPQWYGEGEPWTWPSQYPKNAKIALQTLANTKDEALRLSEKLRSF